MSFQIILVCLLICVKSVDSAKAWSLKSSDTNLDLHSLKLQNVDEFELIRNKRVAGTSKSSQSNKHAAGTSGGKSELIVHPFVLDGTENSPMAYMHWIGKEKSERVFILTCRQNFSSGVVEESQLWLSVDYGISYTKKDFGAGVKISYIYTVPANPGKLIFTDVPAKKLYTTEDELKHHEGRQAPVEPDRLVPHPTDEDKLLLYNSLRNELYVSTNFAADWTLLAKNVLPQFYWGVPGHDHTADIVHMEIEGEVPSQARYKSCVAPFVPCRDNATIGNVGPFLAGTLRVHNEYMLVQKSSSFGSDSYLMVSHERQPFHRAYFPGNVVTDDFIILNLDDGQMFVAVNHRGYVNLYLSDAAGQYFVHSLTNISHVIYPTGFEIDFHEVRGMVWTFLANRMESGTVRTYISFDKGGNWAPLMLNKNCTDPEHYALRLIMKQVIYTTHILSEESAAGIIMAHGTIGTKASSQEIFVFTSSDGGGTWVKATLADGKALTGPFHLNILDRGSILTAIRDGLANDGENTTKVFYSLDQGLHWEEQEFDKTSLRVEGVLTEKGLLTRVESVFGHEGLDRPWKTVKLNFTKILTTKCKDDDYVTWYPRDFNDAKSNNCTLGQVWEYKRPRASAKCYNGDTKIKPKISETCTCTSEDFECDFGYYKSSGDCKKAEWFDDSYIPSECDHGGTYNKSQGYRKIPADKCTEEDADKGIYDTVNTTCPSVKPAGLVILTEAVKLPTGKKIRFHLEQSRGSKFDTTYTWNFGDETEAEKPDGFHNFQDHIFSAPGHFNVTVTAENKKGKTTALLKVHVQERLSDVHIISPWAGKTGREINFYVSDPDVFGSKLALADREHFVWTFGDEADDDTPLLTWHRNVSHTYSKPGKYKITVEVINSISSVYTEYNIEIFDTVEILELTFSKNLTQLVSFSFLREHFALQIKHQLVEDLGLRLERLEAVHGNELPYVWQLYILPDKGAGGPNISDIKKNVMKLAKNKKLKINMKSSWSSYTDILFPVLSVKELPDSDKKTDGNTGLNLKAIFVAVPVLVLALLVTGISFLYCRKRMRSNRQFSILHSQDDSDNLLDDDSPLDLNADFGSRDRSGDDPMLDLDDSRLEISEGSSGNAENC